jgi:hypothetical protein
MYTVDRHEDILSCWNVGVCNRYINIIYKFIIYLYIYIYLLYIYYIKKIKKRRFTRVQKIGKATITLFISIRLFVRNSINSAHETIQLPLVENSWNFMLEDFFKISMDIQVLLKFETNYG